MPIVSLCLGLPAVAGFAQGQAGREPISLPTASAYLQKDAGLEPIKSKGDSKFYNAAEDKPIQVRAKLGKPADKVAILPTESGKGGQADSHNPRLVFNPKHEQKREN